MPPLGPSGVTSHTQLLHVPRARTKTLPSGVITELPFPAAFMEGALVFLSPNDLNYPGGFSRGQPHHFQLKHRAAWDQGSIFTAWSVTRAS